MKYGYFSTDSKIVYLSVSIAVAWLMKNINILKYPESKTRIFQ